MYEAAELRTNVTTKIMVACGAHAASAFVRCMAPVALMEVTLDRWFEGCPVAPPCWNISAGKRHLQ